MSIYKFSAVDNKGAEVALKDYEGKVLLIINTATDCGFTPQYDGIEEHFDTNSHMISLIKNKKSKASRF